MTAVGMENLDLVKYLVSQVMMTDEDRFNELKSTIQMQNAKTGA